MRVLGLGWCQRNLCCKHSRVQNIPSPVLETDIPMYVLRQDELQRAAMLHSAFRNYFNASSAAPRGSGAARRESAVDVADPPAEEYDDDIQL